jgi:hypothetical protein
MEQENHKLNYDFLKKHHEKKETSETNEKDPKSPKTEITD